MRLGFHQTREKVSDIPPDNILNDIEECKMDDLRTEFYKNNTIASNDAQLAGLLFIAAQSARARRMRYAHSFL